MATGLEGAIANGIIGIFGGSIVLTAIAIFGIFMVFLLLLRVPFVLIAPFVVGFSLVVAMMLPELKIIVGLIAGFAVGYFIYSLWTGR